MLRGNRSLPRSPNGSQYPDSQPSHCPVSWHPFGKAFPGLLFLDGFRICRHLLWTRGGFPGSYLARNATVSLRWRDDFIRTYLERDVPILGPRVPLGVLEPLSTMLLVAPKHLHRQPALAAIELLVRRRRHLPVQRRGVLHTVSDFMGIRESGILVAFNPLVPNLPLRSRDGPSNFRHIANHFRVHHHTLGDVGSEGGQ